MGCIERCGVCISMMWGGSGMLDWMNISWCVHW